MEHYNEVFNDIKTEQQIQETCDRRFARVTVFSSIDNCERMPHLIRFDTGVYREDDWNAEWSLIPFYATKGEVIRQAIKMIDEYRFGMDGAK